MSIKIREVYEPANKSEGYKKTVYAILNPEDNGGQSVTLSVDLYDNGDDTNNWFTNTHFNIESYGTASVKFTLWSVEIENLVEAVNKIQSELKKFMSRKIDKLVGGKLYQVKSDHSYYPGKVGQFEFMGGPELDAVVLSVPSRHGIVGVKEMFVVNLNDIECEVKSEH